LGNDALDMSDDELKDLAARLQAALADS
jgi:hypothetical protein